MEEVNDIYRVMLVEDSPLIRGYLQRALVADQKIDVCAVAENGQIAIEIVKQTKPDVILLDIEMPVMDGLTALPLLLKESPSSSVIMVSTLTSKNAAISIEALSKGASDYVEKPSASIDKQEFKKDLISKIKALAESAKKRAVYQSSIPKPEKKMPLSEQFSSIIGKNKGDNTVSSEPSAAKTNAPIAENSVTTSEVEAPKPNTRVNTASNMGGILPSFRPDVLTIGCSTGGPQALQEFFGVIGDSIKNIPIFITQHMPPQFTTFLAKSISTVSGAVCIEGEDGQKVENGVIYLAPGDFHMLVKGDGVDKVIRLTKDEPENFCRPAVDPMLRSVADAYSKKILTVIMTGMGQDGLKGARYVKEKGGKVIIQDEASSVVWGMPGSIASEGFQDAIFSLDEMGMQVKKICNGGL